VFVVEGPDAGKHVELAEEREETVGRASTNALALKDTAASREHLTVSRRGADVLIRDLGSAHGTFLGTAKLEPLRRAIWPSGQMVALGRTVLACRMPPNEAEIETMAASHERPEIGVAPTAAPAEAPVVEPEAEPAATPPDPPIARNDSVAAPMAAVAGEARVGTSQSRAREYAVYVVGTRRGATVRDGAARAAGRRSGSSAHLAGRDRSTCTSHRSERRKAEGAAGVRRYGTPPARGAGRRCGAGSRRGPPAPAGAASA
jgi:hypothetical protein